jgi:hypothetical protein
MSNSSKPLEVYLANTTPTPFNVLPPESGDQRGRVVLVLHRWGAPNIRVTFDRDQWREVVESLTAALEGGTHIALVSGRFGCRLLGGG